MPSAETNLAVGFGREVRDLGSAGAIGVHAPDLRRVAGGGYIKDALAVGRPARAVGKIGELAGRRRRRAERSRRCGGFCWRRCREWRRRRRRFCRRARAEGRRCAGSSAGRPRRRVFSGRESRGWSESEGKPRQTAHIDRIISHERNRRRGWAARSVFNHFLGSFGKLCFFGSRRYKLVGHLAMGERRQTSVVFR